MKKLFVAILVFATLGFSFNISPSYATAETILNNTVSMTSSSFDIEAYPATLGSSGWVTFNVSCKQPDSFNDILLGFGSVGKVTKLQVWENYYHPQKILIQGKPTLTYDEKNVTWSNQSYSYWEFVNLNYFDWRDISLTNQLTKSYQTVSKWSSFDNFFFKQGVTYKFRAYIDIPFSGLTRSSGEYYFSIKPTSVSIDKAITDKTLTTLDPWWNANWRNRTWCVISGSYFDTNLINFPINVSLPADTLKNLQSYAQDIRFVALDNTTLYNYEIESFNINDQAKTCIWVNITNIPEGGTCFWIYTNNSVATDAQNPTGVWSYGYLGVWHMNDSAVIWDSTSFGHSATASFGGNGITKQGRTGNSTWLQGQGYLFGDVNDVGTSTYTIEGGWNVSQPFDATSKRFVGKYEGPPGYHTEVQSQSNREFWFEAYDGANYFDCFILVDTGMDNGAWRWSFASQNSSAAGFVSTDPLRWSKGAASTPGAIGNLDSVYDFKIGTTAGAASSSWYGLIDEVRLSVPARNASWERATYTNLNASYFINYSLSEAAPAAPVFNELITFDTPTNNTIVNPFNATFCVNVYMSNGSHFNITFYVWQKNDTNISLIYTNNFTANSTVCLFININMLFNATYLWYFNATRCNDSGMFGTFNVSNVYYFSTLATPPSGSTSTSTSIGGSIGIIGLIGLFGWILGTRRKRRNW